MGNPVHTIKRYYAETVQEVKKCSWPNKQELIRNTIVVIVSFILLAVVIWLMDQACQYLIKLIIER